MFEELIEKNCFSEDEKERKKAADELEKIYNCEIHCQDMDSDVVFAHHARGCTIIASKICKGAVIYQNVTVGSNMKYNRTSQEWENVGNPVIGENVIVCDGAKILGPIIIGDGSVVASGAIITKDVPKNSIAYGVNQFREKNENYDYVFNSNLPDMETILKTNEKLIKKYEKAD